jgi:outer membrane biogenesis lipoprotein LolB
MLVKKHIYSLVIGTTVVLLFACNNNMKKNDTEEEKAAFHNRLNNIQIEDYNFNSNEFRYDYEVVGIDEKGNEIYGNINIEGEQGEGKLYHTTGKTEINIVIESSENGNIQATDTDGNKYYLKIK